VEHGWTSRIYEVWSAINVLENLRTGRTPEMFWKEAAIDTNIATNCVLGPKLPRQLAKTGLFECGGDLTLDKETTMRLPLLAAFGLITTLGMTMFDAPNASAQTRRATVVSGARGTAIVTRPIGARGAVVVRRPIGARSAVVVRRPIGARSAVVVRRPIGARSAVVVRRPIGARGAVVVRRPIGARGAVVVRRPIGARSAVVVRRPIGARGAVIMRRR
jgi:hypothetical protein